jgi:hypothetical protein
MWVPKRIFFFESKFQCTGTIQGLIRVRIGSKFYDFLDPDPGFESGTRIRIHGQTMKEKCTLQMVTINQSKICVSFLLHLKYRYLIL